MKVRIRTTTEPAGSAACRKRGTQVSANQKSRAGLSIASARNRAHGDFSGGFDQDQYQQLRGEVLAPLFNFSDC
jgi:hypothetical protein